MERDADQGILMSDTGFDRDAAVPAWAAAFADLAVIVVFVLVGRRLHHEDAGVAGFFRVLWPFAVGLAVAWLATGLFRSPLSWRRAVSAWILTVAIGVVLRIAMQGHDFSVAFTIVATLFVGACMLGWRAVVLAVQQRRRCGCRKPVRAG
jgi:Protein of unknown function (DUF3054)